MAPPRRPKPIARNAERGPSRPASRMAKYIPKMGASQVMPTNAPKPPTSGLKRVLDQCSSSPTRRSNVTVSERMAGTKIRCLVERLSEFVSDIRPPAGTIIVDDRRSKKVTSTESPECHRLWKPRLCPKCKREVEREVGILDAGLYHSGYS